MWRPARGPLRFVRPRRSSRISLNTSTEGEMAGRGVILQHSSLVFKEVMPEVTSEDPLAEFPRTGL